VAHSGRIHSNLSKHTIKANEMGLGPPTLDLGGIPVAHAFVVSGTNMATVPVGLDLDSVHFLLEISSQ
jgi:hypothetical protein